MEEEMSEPPSSICEQCGQATLGVSLQFPDLGPVCCKCAYMLSKQIIKKEPPG